MSAPRQVPVSLQDEPRTGLALPPARRWLAKRPADLQDGQPIGPKLGRPGPDQGYAMTLAHRCFADRLQLAEGEHEEDAIAGCVAVALRRASMFRRAPVIHDLDLAFTLFGFVGEPPADLVEFRQPLFQGASDFYWDQRQIADIMPDETLRLTPAQVRERLADWRQLLGQ
jgi:hypothetical protein